MCSPPRSGLAEGGILMIGTPRDGAASFGNGSQVMLSAPSRAAVDAAHGAALEMGGTCEGAPGPRGAAETNMYAAYFRDPDGNKVMVMKVGE
jgi:predicted lactoylglutathione lyase